jgi:hypothetical protein
VFAGAEAWMKSVMERFRRRLVGVAASAAAHLLVLAALMPVAGLRTPPGAGPHDPAAPLVIVQLVRPRILADRAAPQPSSLVRPKTVSLPEPEPAQGAEPSDPGPAGPTSNQAALDTDPIYRVPFRDAVAQADARLRAGLDCAHVDMKQLPQAVLGLCDAVHRLREGAGLDDALQ